ncbi:uncharacterized protein C3orf14 homolog [Egretta garzetta]|uniref:uncharacterized protein C3orf14 homolog n=1 Tax=Egretta garzetta TaxID=188379 RepID=UPI00163BB130|nr:uncharacterized protein C3orf14 homolog [Egretta garzetta]
MSSYLAQEVHLARRHEEILSQRSELLQQMETYLGDKKTKKTWQTQAADAAHKRNAALLNYGDHFSRLGLSCTGTSFIWCDLWCVSSKYMQQRNSFLRLVKSVLSSVILTLHPDTVKLETLYWASIKESLPKWEQFLLGRAEVPIGFKKMRTAKQT